ncbi:MAG: helix-turn-helix domain-containing protein [Roseburia sp.]|nr:helix-turn-helix domain-containing protein [Roseburia sp.]
MPKTNFCENREAKRYNYIAGMLECGIRQQCLSTKDLSRKTGAAERTVTERLKHPEKMQLRDLYKMCDVAGVKITFELKDVPE